MGWVLVAAGFDACGLPAALQRAAPREWLGRAAHRRGLGRPGRSSGGESSCQGAWSSR